MRAGLIVVAALAVVAAPGATGAAPPQSIAFTSDRACGPSQSFPLHADIYTMDADGSNVQRLTSTCLDSEPSWSWDGSQVAFTSGRDGYDAIYVMDADGTGAQRVTPDGMWARSPDWSRQGPIAFGAAVGIGIVDPRTSQTRVITQDGREPSWSTDGAHIAFVHDDAATRYADTIGIVDASGANERDVGPGTDPAYSPDGRHLAWSVRNASNGADVVVADADGSNPRTIATVPSALAGSWELQPAWSPDSSTIAFDAGPTAEIWSVPAAGGAPVRLTVTAAAEIDPSWRPAVPSTGLAIASIRFAHGACSARPGRTTVTVVDAQGRPLASATVAIGTVQVRTRAAGIAVLSLPKAHRRGRVFLTVRAVLTGRAPATKRVSLPGCR